ncbi:MAG: 50S ribosomal protein L5, partial [Clostridiales bacterium]|nr:50S ribosomal protein L5 [Clostridiales bacterium]
MAEKKTAAAKTTAAKKDTAPKAAQSRVKAQFDTEVVPYLMKKFGYQSVMQVPKLEKIVINTGLGDIKDNQKSMQIIENELKMITGQKPIYRKATKSVANFKVREGMNIGLKVTLRGKRMYDFYDKLVSIALPRVRDFRGVSDKSFDGRGNYSMGLK